MDQQDPRFAERIAEIFDLLQNRADASYGLAGITQRQHALQAAMFAEADGLASPGIAAALLHDVGHLIHQLGDHPAGAGIDDRHEDAGNRYLARWFPENVTEPIRLHVAAKRYLCAIEPGYFGKLSADSVLSLSLQGGPMSRQEADQFELLRYWRQAVQLRRYDEAAKIRDFETPTVAHFLPHVAASLI